MKEIERRDIPTQIKLFTLETPLQDVISKRSSFNPYPEKGEMMVWSIEGAEWNPRITIKYPQAGELFLTVIPFTDEEHVVNPRSIPKEFEPEPIQILPSKEHIGQWNSLEDAWTGIVYGLMRREANKIDVDPLLEQAIAPTQNELGEPNLESPRDATFSIYRLAVQKIEEDDWQSGIGLMRAMNRGTYKLHGKEVNGRDVGIFEYGGKDGMVLELFPQLKAFDTPWAEGVDLSTHPFSVSIDLRRFLEEKVESLALEKAILLEKNPTVRDNYILLHRAQQRTIKDLADKFDILQEKLGIEPSNRAASLPSITQ